MFFFISFADRKSAPMLRRIHANAENTGWFDCVETLDESSFEKKYIKKYGKYFHLRGFGYWMWKSYIVMRALEKLNNGDILLYADAGCTLNKNGTLRFNEYVNKLRANSFGLLVFEQDGLLERQWTKADLLKYTNNDGSTPQFWAGAFMLIKSDATVKFIWNFYDLCHNRFDLINDSPSLEPNASDFIQNRHDQSAFSCLAKKCNPVIINASETYTNENFQEVLYEYPIWATRFRQYTWWGLKKMALKRKFPFFFGKLW